MKPLHTTVREVLQQAIDSEVATRGLYLALADHVESNLTRAKLLDLARRELEHRSHLEQRFRDLIGEEPSVAEESEVHLAADLAPLDLGKALKFALEHERESESNYRFLAERVPADSELGKLFVELAEIEWRHKIEVEAEYHAADQDPERFLLDM